MHTEFCVMNDEIKAFVKIFKWIYDSEHFACYLKKIVLNDLHVNERVCAGFVNWSYLINFIMWPFQKDLPFLAVC